MPWPLVAIAMIGAPITGVTFISVPGMVVNKGFSYLQMGLGFIIGYLIIAFLLVPIYYRLNIVSVYEYLQKRFGNHSYKTGAWLFFVSKVIGISIRFLIVCAILQLLVFDPLGIPFIFSVITGVALIWLSTYRGGVKSVIWSDSFKSLCLITAILLCLYFILSNLNISFGELPSLIANHENSRIFFFDDPMDGKYFWKQVVAGIFIVVAMTGLDQDMMQRTLACKNIRAAQKNLLISSVMQVVVISCLLVLGIILTIYASNKGLSVPEKTDNLFPMIAFHEAIPIAVGCLFILGIISATYASAGSALTAMTTTVTMDLLDGGDKAEGKVLARKRKTVHALISLLIAILVLCFYFLNDNDAISTVYALISYTDGPILGLFLFGILTNKWINDRWLPVICIVAPVLSWIIQWGAESYFGYQISFELIIINAGLTMLGLFILSALTLPERKQLSAA